MTVVQRLFFALWPPPATCSALACAIARLPPLPGQPLCPQDWHLTLAFIGACGPERRAGLWDAAATVIAPPFALRLDRCGVFMRSAVAWVGCFRPPPELAVLHQRLSTALSSVGWQPPGQPFVPHVTLARRCRRWAADVLPTPCDWPVSDFVLAESRPGGPDRPRYAILARWPLTGVGT